MFSLYAVEQLNSTPDSSSGGCGFKSHQLDSFLNLKILMIVGIDKARKIKKYIATRRGKTWTKWRIQIDFEKLSIKVARAMYEVVQIHVLITIAQTGSRSVLGCSELREKNQN
jgi:hypothetical protein